MPVARNISEAAPRTAGPADSLGAAVPASPIAAATLDRLIERHELHTRPAADRLWAYYRNPLTAARPDRPREPAQAMGLPPRLRTRAGTATPPRERVIENDIAWRVHTLVDFMFGRSITLQSLAPDDDRATFIGSHLRNLFTRSGGIAFFQDLALLGSVYGHVDVLLRIDSTEPSLGDDPFAHMRLEIVDPPRSIPLVNPTDYRTLDAFLIHARRTTDHNLGADDTSRPSFLTRVRQRLIGDDAGFDPTPLAHGDRADAWTEVFTHERRAVYVRDGGATRSPRRMTEVEVNRLGRVPVVHIQNLPQPFAWEGLGDVEPLIPLQDELNTRLSDRANRVTFQSFKMYLGRGIDGFIDRPVGPGQMWQTDNLDANIQEFGGDADTPSESAHINEIREAMDKTSGVSPVAAGILRGKVGNLTSENALRIVLMGLLARTQKKRTTYGRGIEAMCELAMHAADVLGRFPNDPVERDVRVEWPNPLPEAESQRLRDAQLKLTLGIPRNRVLAELGYEAEC